MQWLTCKTHKCFEIAKMQLDAGAVGVTCAKPTEALQFIESGILLSFTNSPKGINVPSITIAYPIVELIKLDKLLQSQKAHNNKTTLRFIVDSEYGADIMAK